MTDDALTGDAILKVNEAQEVADEELLGEDRYTEVLLWEDGDFRISVFHGFDTPIEKEAHHGERIVYKESRGDFIYEILKNNNGNRGHKILKSKVVR